MWVPRHNPLYLNISWYIFRPFFLHIAYGIDKENLFNNQKPL